MSETSTGDHLPAGARWGYADGNPSSEAPLFLLLHRHYHTLQLSAGCGVVIFLTDKEVQFIS
jgi:hypothetical protein